MTIEENESHVLFDYAGNTVNIYTTRYGVRNGVYRRVGEENVTTKATLDDDGKEAAWDMTMSMEYCRDPHYITKVNND